MEISFLDTNGDSRALELCPMWDSYGQLWNLSEDYGSRICFFSDRSRPYNVTNVTPYLTPATFLDRKMEHGLWNISARTDSSTKSRF